MRCQYVSGLLLQCKNSLPPNTSVPVTSGQNQTITDNTNVFCEKHQSFIDNVKVHANVSRSALDPGFKPTPHMAGSEDVLLSSKRSLPSHVFEPCCSDSAAFSEDNPLRFAGLMTDKEIVQQYNAALGRMINKVNDMRFIIHSRYMEHLKKKSAVTDERKKYKIFVRDPGERARLERLKSDMSYGRYNRTAATYLQKSYRKYKAEQLELRGHENINTWLETPERANGEMCCDYVEKIDPATSFYTSPKITNESNSDESARAVLDSLLNAVIKQEDAGFVETRCSGRRIPMTDFCAEHLKLDSEIRLLAQCKECKAPCLDLDNKLCGLHARTLFIPLPPLPQVPLVAAPVQTISQRLQSNNKDRSLRMPTLGSNWSVNNRQLLMRDSNGFSNFTTIRKPEVKYDINSLCGPLTLKNRQPRDKLQKILKSEIQPNEALLAEQSKLKFDNSDNLQILIIDDDLPMDELQKQCEQRTILDNTPTAPLHNQPKTKRSMLRVNGANGNGIVIRGPIAIIQNPSAVGSHNSNNIPLVAVNRNGKLNGVIPNGCARTRIYTRADRDRKVARFFI